MMASGRPIRFVMFVDGLLLVGLAFAMSVPMLLDLAAGDPDWQVFAASAAVSLFVGGVPGLSSRGEPLPADRRTGYLFTVSAWLFIGTVAAPIGPASVRRRGRA